MKERREIPPGADPASLSNAEVIAIWEAVDGDPTEEQVLALGEIERRNLDL